MKKQATHWLAAVVWLAAAAGCKTTSTPPAVDPSPPEAQVPAESDLKMTQKAEEPIVAELRPIYFEFNRWDLTDEARETLRTNAAQIEQNPELGTVTIEGHCDERGSAEYNLALGERRATAVRRYLEDLGLESTRFETVTFGENRPAVSGHDESAWRYNRRSELRSEELQVSGR